LLTWFGCASAQQQRLWLACSSHQASPGTLPESWQSQTSGLVWTCFPQRRRGKRGFVSASGLVSHCRNPSAFSCCWNTITRSRIQQSITSSKCSTKPKYNQFAVTLLLVIRLYLLACLSRWQGWCQGW
jgi:hypothetical protein